MSERLPLQKGLFVPGRRGWDLRGDETRGDMGVSILTAREKALFDTLSKVESRDPFSRVVDKALITIVGEELGVDVISPHPRRAAVQRVVINAITRADSSFDSQRDRFAPLMAEGGDPFLSALHSVPLGVGDQNYHVGEAIGVVNKMVADPALYPLDAQVLVSASLQDLITVGIKEAARNDSTNLTGMEAQQVKETTNALYAGLLFDVLYAPYMANPGYARARDRYIAMRLALQYGDDVVDVAKDLGEGSANLIVAYAGDMGELEGLVAVNKGVVYEPMDLAVRSVRDTAPGAYGLVVQRQEELLSSARIPAGIERQLLLPNT